jgi:hypothetical protein
MMRITSSKVLAVVLVTGLFSSSAQADSVSCSGEALATGVTASAASSALGAALGGVSLANATAAQLSAAYAAAVTSNAGMASDIASLMALGRPDQIASIEDAVKGSCPQAAPAILKKIAETASNPTADQLAALANQEGAAPAAGDEGSP